jgi:hypothetical protein
MVAINRLENLVDRWHAQSVAPAVYPTETIMRVVIGWDGRGADKLGETMAKIVAKYPNAVFLIPEHWNGAHYGLLIRNTVDLHACAISFHLNRAKLGDQAFEMACLRACIEGEAQQVVSIGEVPELDEAARRWTLALWKIEVPAEAPAHDAVKAQPEPEGVA